MTTTHTGDNPSDGTADDTVATAALGFEALLTGKPDNRKPAEPDDSDAEDDSLEEDAEAHLDEASSDDAEEEEGDEPETTDDDEESDSDAEEPKTLDPQTDADIPVKVKLGDKEATITLRDLADGYMMRAEFTRKSQQLAETRKAVEAESAAVRGSREQYAEMVEKLGAKLQQLDEFDRIDFDALYQTDPHRYVREVEAKRERDDHLRAVAIEKQKIEHDRQIEAQKARAARAEETWETVKAAMPAWQDQKVWAKDQTLILDYAREAGFTPDEIRAACATDHRVLLSMHAAAQYNRLMQNKPKANKATASAPVARTVSRANAPKPSDQHTRAKMRLKESGRVEDAAALFERLLK